jgi:acetolactate synthase-1/2/3 large subunit
MSASLPAADLLVRRLLDHGVRVVFGYPGGQMTPIYDALYRIPGIRHILSRHEQASAFMADGYARSSGLPGVCLAVCGPGVFNAATAVAASFTDSVPVLLISGQVPSTRHGPRSGCYHENNQLSACATFTKARFRVEDPARLVPSLDEAWLALTTGRPGPVLFEVPIDVLRTSVSAEPWPSLPTPPPRSAPTREEIASLARRLQGWQRPLILAGGGVVASGAEEQLPALAERLGAPVLHTANGKGGLPAGHPLHAGLTWHRATSDLSAMADSFSPLFAQADGLLALGCRFTQLATGTWTLRPPRDLVQIDIDAEEIGRHYPVSLGIRADLAVTLEALLRELPAAHRPPWQTIRPTPGKPWRLPGPDILEPMRRALPPDTILSVDVTRLGYILMADYPLESSRCFLHPAGAVAMGYGLPAALGARAAQPDRPVVAVVGDGGFQMSALELASSVQERLPVVVLLINDACLTLIRATQERSYGGRLMAVNLHNPDFELLARAFGVSYARANTDAELETALRAALAREETTLVEVRPTDGT